EAPTQAEVSTPGLHAAGVPTGLDHEPTGGRPDIPGYRVVAYVGGGGMGSVYRAVHLATGRMVAVKLTRPGADDDRTRQRFEREVRALAALDHPNVVRVYDAGVARGCAYYTMQFLPRGSLDAHLARFRDPRRAAGLMARVARAVGYVHDQGLLHRDLKPLNILLGEGDEPKLADFGLTRRVHHPDQRDGVSSTGFPVGTGQYMAPEQTSGRSEDYTHACDTWALGVTLYELLTGRRPFAEFDGFDLYKATRERDPQPIAERAPDVPPELAAVVMRCLAKNPTDRYESAEALAEDLERWLAGVPVLAPPPALFIPRKAESPDVASGGETPPAEPRPTPAGWWPRRRWQLAGAAVLTAVVAGACIFPQLKADGPPAGRSGATSANGANPPPPPNGEKDGPQPGEKPAKPK
ncbi:MAG: serine/threonine protein kinase, partial [Gemmataceae bacterium]|nr:serine/threonine protein kinase [Gemmataceae bacterium]